jgi:hypothetical protein
MCSCLASQQELALWLAVWNDFKGSIGHTVLLHSTAHRLRSAGTAVSLLVGGVVSRFVRGVVSGYAVLLVQTSKLSKPLEGERNRRQPALLGIVAFAAPSTDRLALDLLYLHALCLLILLVQVSLPA